MVLLRLMGVGRSYGQRQALRLLAGAAGGFVLHLMALGALGSAVGAGALVGALVAALATTTGALVERFGTSSAAVRRWTASLWLLLLTLGGTAVLAALGYPLPWLAPALAWSGPWGWAAQPVVAAAGGYAPGWPLAVVLLAVTTGAALLVADRAVAGLRGATVRARARAVGNVISAMRALQPRQARLAMCSAQGADIPARLRLPPPRRRLLLLPWRDVTALLQHPGRLWWYVLLLALAHVLAALTATTGGILVVLLTVGTAYLAAAQLVESARLDADDTRRSAMLPYRYASLALAHAVVPVALLIAGGAVAVGLLPLTGASVLPGLLLIAATPALVGAALVSAYRGVLPRRLLAGLAFGMDTGSPIGDITPVTVAVWYARGPLVVLALLTPGLYGALQSAAGLGGACAAAAPWLAVAAALLLTWARRQAANWYRS
ncbi:MAG: hypothetical protein ACRDN9_13435 [Streptosporangiaceae bacterium]